MNKTQSKSSEKTTIELAEVGFYLKLISQEHPDVHDNGELARLISEGFDIICTKDVIDHYECLHVEYERDSQDRLYHAIALGEIEKYER